MGTLGLLISEEQADLWLDRQPWFSLAVATGVSNSSGDSLQELCCLRSYGRSASAGRVAPAGETARPAVNWTGGQTRGPSRRPAPRRR